MYNLSTCQRKGLSSTIWCHHSLDFTELFWLSKANDMLHFRTSMNTSIRLVCLATWKIICAVRMLIYVPNLAVPLETCVGIVTTSINLLWVPFYISTALSVLTTDLCDASSRKCMKLWISLLIDVLIRTNVLESLLVLL